MHKLTILVTSHNRRNQTLTCLQRISEQALPDDVVTKIYLYDAGSSDGTQETVSSLFPDVELIRGDSSIYWAGGMLKAWRIASKEYSDFYLLLNDDTALYSEAIAKLIRTYTCCFSKNSIDGIVVGSVCDPNTKRHTYGGVRRKRKFLSLSFSSVAPTSSAVPVDTFNGNLVLIPKPITDQIGFFFHGYQHSKADFDFGLLAQRNGFPIILAAGVWGECERNSIVGTWEDAELSFSMRLKHLRSPKGLPVSEWLQYTRRNAGIGWPLYWLTPYLKFGLSAIRNIRK